MFLYKELGEKFWEDDPKIIFEAIVSTLMLLLFVGRNTYLMFRRLYSKEIATSYFFGFLFTFYVSCTIAARIHIDTPYKNILLVGSLAMFVTNCVYLVVCYPIKVVNVGIYLLARIFSRSTCFVVLNMFGYLCVITMGLIAWQSIGMYWIDVHLKWAPLIEGLYYFLIFNLMIPLSI